jgi:predicted nucleotidyltransferase
MRYKTIMLGIDSYAKLARAKEAFRKASGLKLSFSDIILELISKNLDFLPIEGELKAFIKKFVDGISASEEVEGILLFGSVAKGTYDKYSDIDILVVTKHKKGKMLEKLLAATKSLKGDSEKLMSLNLPSLINPIILDESDLKRFRPFYFDFADYGVILYERGGILSDFTSSLKRLKHKREIINNVEVLTW